MVSTANQLRLRKIVAKAREEGLEGVVLVPGPNMRYLTGVVSQLLERPFLLFVPVDGRPHLVAPAFESGPYERLGLEIAMHRWGDETGPAGAFQGLARQLDLDGKRWGCEARVPYGYLHHLLSASSPKLEDGEPIFQSLREVKDAEEIRNLKKAAAILARSYLELPGMLKQGISEQEIARRLKEEIYARGGETVGFCLVQAGERGADPHSDASARRLKRGEGLVVDAGCTYRGYNADITRTFILGRNERLEEIYLRVLEAQEAAIRKVGEGVRVGEVDAAARGALTGHGLGRYFIHRTGHGLGLEEHESPYVVSGGEETLRRFEALTVEPGVYMPGEMGVRIEDDVVVSASGKGEVITGDLPKELGWWR